MTDITSTLPQHASESAVRILSDSDAQFYGALGSVVLPAIEETVSASAIGSPMEPRAVPDPARDVEDVRHGASRVARGHLCYFCGHADHGEVCGAKTYFFKTLCECPGHGRKLWSDEDQRLAALAMSR